MTVVELINEMLDEVDKKLEKCLEYGDIQSAGIVSAVGSGLGALQLGLTEGSGDVALNLLKAFLDMVGDTSKTISKEDLLGILGACAASDEED